MNVRSPTASPAITRSDRAAAAYVSCRAAATCIAMSASMNWMPWNSATAFSYRLVLDFGIRPRAVSSLPDIVTAPFLHFSRTHLEGNSGAQRAASAAR